MPPKTSSTTSRVPPEILAHLKDGNIESIEELWLARLEDKKLDLDEKIPFFIAVARALDKGGATETARFLLELVDENLMDANESKHRMELLRRTGHLIYEPEDLHAAITETLDDLHADLPSYELMVEKVGIHRATDDIPKIWQKVDRLQGLLAFDVGSIVHMTGKGAGKVLDVNMALESFKVEFENGLELRVGFGGAAKLLKTLPKDHVLYRKMTEPETLIKLRDEEPAELLRTVLASYGKPRTGAEIKRTLFGIVPEKRWSRWWSAARKHPQVLAAPGGRRAYTWAASSEDAHEAIWESFEKAEARPRLDLLRRSSDRDPDLKRRMSESLAENAAAAVAAGDPGLACDIWFTLDRYGELPAAASWSPQALLSEIDDPRKLFKGIKDRISRERAYEILKRSRQDWNELFGQLLWQETDARALDTLSNALIEVDPERFSAFLDLLMSQPRRNPAAFTWFSERASTRQEWLERNPLRLLNQLLWVISNDQFAPFRASRLMPLMESGGTLPKLIALLDEDQAVQAFASIRKAAALKSYRREPLLNAILLRFPSLREEGESALYATIEMIKAKRAELKELKEVEIPANRRAIEEARELGDLSENFEYKSARQRHEYLAARASALNNDLSRARPIDARQVRGDEIVVGSRVLLVTDGGDKRTITILGPWESDPENDVLSHESEIAKSMLGLGAGDDVKFGDIDYKVTGIEPFE